MRPNICHGDEHIQSPKTIFSNPKRMKKKNKPLQNQLCSEETHLEQSHPRVHNGMSTQSGEPHDNLVFIFSKKNKRGQNKKYQGGVGGGEREIWDFAQSAHNIPVYT